MSSGIKIHERHELTTRAKNDLECEIIKWRQRHELTLIEQAMLLTGLASEPLKYALRYERHGRFGKKADEA